MKPHSILNKLLLGSLLISTGSAFACPDYSGKYVNDDETIFVFKQTACEEVVVDTEYANEQKDHTVFSKKNPLENKSTIISYGAFTDNYLIGHETTIIGGDPNKIVTSGTYTYEKMVNGNILLQYSYIMIFALHDDNKKPTYGSIVLRKIE